MTRKILDFVIIALLAISVSFGLVLIGAPHKIDPARAILANLFDKVGIVDFYIKNKHVFGRVVAPFEYGKELNGKASLIYIRAVTEDEYRCQLLVDSLNMPCPFTLTQAYWDKVESAARAKPNDINNALLATAKQMKTLETKYHIRGEGRSVVKSVVGK